MLRPKNVQCWISSAYGTRRYESIAATESILLEAVQLHPSEAIVHFDLACYAAQEGKIEKSRAYLRTALRRRGRVMCRMDTSEHNGKTSMGSSPASVSTPSPSPTPGSNAGNISNSDVGKTPNGSAGTKSPYAGNAKDSPVL